MPVAFAPAPARHRLRGSEGGKLLAFHPAPASRVRFFRPELDGLRLLAFLMVWGCHSLPSEAESLAHGVSMRVAAVVELLKEAGNLGVPVFFFLSAYLITELLRRELAATGTVALRNFYLRRILRIWPLYLGILGAYAVLGLHFHGFWVEPGRIAASLLMAGNWYIAFHPAIQTPLRALWSLSVEEQFYAGWPLLARWASRRTFLLTCVALLLLGQASLLFLSRGLTAGPMLHVTAWVNSLVQFQFFALGALSALLLQGETPKLAGGQRAWLLAAALGAMLGAASCGIKHAEPTHGAAAMCLGYGLAGLGCVLLMLGVLDVPGRVVPHVVRKLGQVSFGLYVFHETGFFLADGLLRRAGWGGSRMGAWEWAGALGANKILALALTVGMALISYTWWERPFLLLKERFTTVRSREA
jgi:peptidoglycan/LPS O-acetylase OafA/YrhL